MEEMRLNKYLSDAGVCSRREADRLMEAGQILVDGIPAAVGAKIRTDADIRVRGRRIRPVQEKVLLALNKPAGIVCTAEKREKDNVVDFVNYPVRVYPVGRLDRQSTGLLLLTNDGSLVNRIMRAGNYHEKEYLVRIDRPADDAFLEKMRAGVPILDTVTRPCRVTRTGENTFRIVLTQGLNRQIRRMCEALGRRVVSLQRIRIMNIRLDGLKEGAIRLVEGEERAKLDQLLSASSSLSVKERMGERDEE